MGGSESPRTSSAGFCQKIDEKVKAFLDGRSRRLTLCLHLHRHDLGSVGIWDSHLSLAVIQAFDEPIRFE